MTPIRKEDRDRYPADWKDISHWVRFTRGGGRCECRGECGMDHHGRCESRHGLPNPATGSVVVLTTAHLNHTPEDCSPENLRGMCQACHLRYDRDHHAATRRRTRDQEAGQRTLFDTPTPVPGFHTAGDLVHAYLQRLIEASEDQEDAA